ncbi:hypothetical protein [Vibrio rotiferianus]|uniref:hypothetical protein n=1 Tax=Vibrio rotiferianus TaxID=190895 RepID=UPI000B59E97E|nr:hypothetical protein [Vibrio rotiferianus]ASI93745.1 hypothetical protein BSZ04_01590 [Vibrio rotiferianus]
MRFIDTKVSKEGRYSLGIEQESGEHYISIPVANSYVDYEEYYRLSIDEYAALHVSSNQAVEFAEKCRRRECDERLIVAPGRLRGEPV